MYKDKIIMYFDYDELKDKIMKKIEGLKQQRDYTHDTLKAIKYKQTPTSKTTSSIAEDSCLDVTEIVQNIDKLIIDGLIMMHDLTENYNELDPIVKKMSETEKKIIYCRANDYTWYYTSKKANKSISQCKRIYNDLQANLKLTKLGNKTY
jgi:hypothetical protein